MIFPQLGKGLPIAVSGWVHGLLPADLKLADRMPTYRY